MMELRLLNCRVLCWSNKRDGNGNKLKATATAFSVRILFLQKMSHSSQLGKESEDSLFVRKKFLRRAWRSNYERELTHRYAKWNRNIYSYLKIAEGALSDILLSF